MSSEFYSILTLLVVARLDDIEQSRAEIPSKLLLWAQGMQSFENSFALEEGDNGTLYVINREDGTEASFAITGYMSQYWLPSARLSGRQVFIVIVQSSS